MLHTALRAGAVVLCTGGAVVLRTGGAVVRCTRGAAVVCGVLAGVVLGVAVGGSVVGLGESDTVGDAVVAAAAVGVLCPEPSAPAGPHAASATSAAAPVRTPTTVRMRFMSGTVDSAFPGPPPETVRLRRAPIRGWTHRSYPTYPPSDRGTRPPRIR
jgi:hypothetical protein